MAKLGIGVGEEFPVEEAGPPPPPTPEDEERRRWRPFYFLHLLGRVGVIALIVSVLVWLFRPIRPFYPDPYLLPYGFFPYPHHVFFPFFPLLLVGLLIAILVRRRSCYGPRDWNNRHHWHRPNGADRNGEGG
ncbi:MAG TPA: hypothetical protein VEU06_02575 [Micropepsaceae bacterium]|nr:hypothetical protein [Micropepsaceae bacterium]